VKNEKHQNLFFHIFDFDSCVAFYQPHHWYCLRAFIWALVFEKLY